jgi:hypothetical protein
MTKPDDWPFDVPPDLGCITTRQLMREGYPVLAILHDEDGAWQVLCNTTQDPADGMLVDLGCLFERFPLMRQFAHIPRGHEAVRESADAPWRIVPTEYEQS